MFISFGLRFGKKHKLSIKEGVCRFCGRTSNLKSFEANKYFHVYWIPIIPLGKKKVDCHCNRCDQHLETPYKDWKALAEGTLHRTKKAFENNIHDVKYGIQYFEALYEYGNRGEAQRFKEFLEDKFKGDDYLRSYFKGPETVEEFTDVTVESLAENVHQNPENEDSKYALGWSLFKRGEYQEAYQVLMNTDHPVRGRGNFNGMITLSRQLSLEDSYKVFTLLAKSYPHYANGHHLFNELIVEKEKDLNIPEERTLVSDEYKKTKRNQKLIPIVIISGLLVILLAVFSVSYFNQKVYILNGSTQSINVSLGSDTDYLIGPLGFTLIKMSPGDYKAVVETSNNTREIDFSISSDFSDFIGSGRIYVINPNGSAIITWEEIVYSVDPNASGGSYEVHVGEEFKIYDRIDYPFEDAPEEIQVDSYKGKDFKTTLTFLNAEPYEGSMILMYYPEGHSRQDQLDYMEFHIKENHRSEEYLRLYDSLSHAYNEMDRANAFLKELKMK